MSEFSWNAFSFVVELENGEEYPLCNTAKLHCPKKGEYVWVQGVDKEKAKEKFGTSAFIVVDVAHHVGTTKTSYDSIVIYCDPVTREKVDALEFVEHNPNEINLQYLAKDYKPQNINFNCVCQTREQFELFSKFLLEFQRIGGKVV